MSTFEDVVNAHYDSRLGTLARIKSRSLGADALVLSALTVLTYAQLEGGIKDLAASVIKHVNARKLGLGEVAPALLHWRNQEDLTRLRSMVTFEMVGEPSPFGVVLNKRVKVNSINRHRELNQMSWAALKKVYEGFGLDYKTAERSAEIIDDLVAARNKAAHHGSMLTSPEGLLENHVRKNVAAVEDVLTDLCLQLLTFFSTHMHTRAIVTT